MQRESFTSRLGFLLVSAGCAIGIGNVWRFPTITGQYGGGVFVLFYLLFLLLMGVPVLTMELAVGRAGHGAPTTAYKALEPKGSRWHLHGWVCLLGCCMLMMYYTTVSGWMADYFVKFLTGAMENTPQGWMACCELAELLMQQAALWRRRQGYTDRKRATGWPWRSQDRAAVRTAVRQAIARGFYRSVPSGEDAGEINLVLAAREDERAEDPERLRVGVLAVCAARLHLAPADALLLTPGEYLDMVTLLSGGEEGDYGGPEN